MNVLILGSTGHVGSRLLELSQKYPHINCVGASRHDAASSKPGAWVQLDTLDERALRNALVGKDAVVNCVAGSGHAIEAGAQVLVNAAKSADLPRIIHLSSMSVYGNAEGLVAETLITSPELGWYAKAKCEAERAILEYAALGETAVVLRPGCIFGRRSELWVGRIGRLLKSGRLGDLGSRGDGWSNLVHVDDVCSAIFRSLEQSFAPDSLPVFNLAAPDSPRWNDYFTDLAIAIDATPVSRVAHWRMALDCWSISLPLKAVEKSKIAQKVGIANIPDALTPGLLGLWQQQIQLDVRRATNDLNMTWTPYSRSLEESASWFSGIT